MATTMDKILTVVSLLISIPALATAAFFVFRGSLQVAQIEALRKDCNDLRSRVDDKDEEITELKENKTELTVKNEVLTLENQRVWEQVTQKADVEGVKVLLNSVISLLRTNDERVQ
jgi:Zn-dependent M32 family carboxypeptidase